MSHTVSRSLAAALALGAIVATAHAADRAWPAKSVRIVVPFDAGGASDTQGRLLARHFSESMGHTFVVDNRPGSAGLIGAGIVAESPPDGYNVLLTTASLASNVSLYRKKSFDPLKDLAPVSRISSVPLVLIVYPSVPAKSVKELVALARNRGVRMNAASNGTGTTSHLSLEMLRQMAGINVTHIPYKGGGPAMAAMLAGEVDVAFAVALTALPHLKSGKVRGLAVTTARRSGVFPELPTMASIYPGFEMDNWYAIFVPAGTPKEIVAKLNAEILKALKASDVRDFIGHGGGEPVGSTPDELAKYFHREVEKYRKVIKAGNISAE